MPFWHDDILYALAWQTTRPVWHDNVKSVIMKVVPFTRIYIMARHYTRQCTILFMDGKIVIQLDYGI